MKRILFIVLVFSFALSSCTNEMPEAPYPYPRYPGDLERLHISSPASDIDEYMTGDPVRALHLMVEMEDGGVVDQQWLLYELDQPWYKPDGEMYIVVERDTISKMGARESNWLHVLFSKDQGDHFEETIERRKAYWEEKGLSVTVTESGI